MLRPIKNSGVPLVEMEGAGYRRAKRWILSGITWSLRQGESWVVHGSNGAGKTSFLRLVRGDIWPAAKMGERRYHLGGPPGSPLRFREASRLVSAELLEWYRRKEWNLSVGQVVATGIKDTAYLSSPPVPEEQSRVRSALDMVGLRELAERSVLATSRGQAKRVLLARALAGDPQVLLLDEGCEDLDAESQERMAQVVGYLRKEGRTLVYATHRNDLLTAGFSHELEIAGGKISRQGPRRESADSPGRVGPAPMKCGSPVPLRGRPSYTYLVRIRKGQVYREETRILRDINLTLRPGENWALLGANGAGKTSLIEVLTGDLRPALGGSIDWFGNCAKLGRWELRQRISLVASHTQTRHRYRISALDTVLSGYQGSIQLHREPTSGEVIRAREWMEFMGVQNLAQRDLQTLSYGQIRRLMIARAMVTGPELLLLDEPVAGLDPAARAHVLHLVDGLARGGVGVVMVTHHREDLVPAITHLGLLDRGRLVYQGPREEAPPGI